MGEAAALAPGAGTEQKGTHGGGQAHAHRVHVGFDVLHGVEDAEAVVNGAPRRVDVEVDVLLGILSFEEEQLGHDPVGRLSRDRFSQKHDPLAQQTGIDVERTFTPSRLFNHNRDRRHRRKGLLGPILLSSGR